MLTRSLKKIIILFIFFFSSISNAEEIFLSLKNKVNVRYGPSFEFPIKFIYKKINFPIKQIDKKKILEELLTLKITVVGYTFHN